jgi:hypothetical protein
MTTKRVLVVWWSQSGQLRTVAEAFTRPFEDAGHEVVFLELHPVRPFPFPWKVTTFFGEFPETVLGRPAPIAPVAVPPGEWDLVVLTTQVWFLSPSQPFAALLAGADRGFLAGRRVLTLVSCRNMWVRGWRRLVTLVEAAGGRVTDRVVATHSGSVFASYFTTLAWMLTGRRDAIKVLPAAGLAEDTFTHLAALGKVAAARLADAPVDAPLLADQTTAGISHAHAFGEQLVGPLFPVLATIIAAISRPGTTLRSVCAVGMLAFILSAVIGLFIPCVLTERLLRRWIDPWLDGLARLPVSR